MLARRLATARKKSDLHLPQLILGGRLAVSHHDIYGLSCLDRWRTLRASGEVAHFFCLLARGGVERTSQSGCQLHQEGRFLFIRLRFKAVPHGSWAVFGFLIPGLYIYIYVFTHACMLVCIYLNVCMHVQEKCCTNVADAI